MFCAHGAPPWSIDIWFIQSMYMERSWSDGSDHSFYSEHARRAVMRPCGDAGGDAVMRPCADDAAMRRSAIAMRTTTEHRSLASHCYNSIRSRHFVLEVATTTTY